MAGPGRYVPDATEGITCAEDLPEPKVIQRSCSHRRRPCARCGRSCYRDRTSHRTLHDLGDLLSGRPHDIHLTYSVYYCSNCQKYFNADMIMDEVYRLFDRRCRTDTALAKLAKLRSRVRRFKQVGKTLSKLFSPNLDKALTFLDDKLLPSTSNAVERGYRRHRKMQKSIYRVRTMSRLIARIALDMLRDLQSLARSLTTKTLHQARAG